MHDANNIRQCGWTDDLTACRDFINGLIRSSHSLVPRSIQADVYFFLEKYTSRDTENEPDFLRHFHDPVWSILFHLSEWLYGVNPGKRDILAGALAAQGLSLMLHTLDDHLCDGEISLGHTLLIYRSEVWNEYIRQMDRLLRLLSVSYEIFNSSYDRYCRGINIHDGAQSLEEYFDSFKLTMELGCVAPRMLMAGASVKIADIQNIIDSFCAFGLAWRIQDDIDDIERDIQTGKKTSVYFVLDPDLQSDWLREDFNCDLAKNIRSSSSLDALVGRNNELVDFAQSIAERYNMPGLGREYAGLHLSGVFMPL